MKIIYLYFLIFTLSFAQIKNYRVSPKWVNDPNEVAISVNPVNPSMVVAAANINYFYSSSDSGKTWKQKIMSSTMGVWGDPNLLFDDSGNLFFAHLSNPNKNYFPSGFWIDRIVVQKSTDSGVNWNNGSGIGFNSPKNQDKEWMAYDFTNSSHKGNLYIAWTEFDDYGSSRSSDSSRILFSRSLDKGETWSTPIKISDKSGNCIDSDETVEGAVPAIGPNGEVYISWAGPNGIMFDKSLDGGKSFGKDVFVTSLPGGWDFAIPGIYRANGLPITACDIAENSPYKGNIYINWSDQRNGSNNTDVFIVKSSDGGKSWSKPIRVNNDNSLRHQFFTWMTVDRVTGIIYVVFYDRRETTGNLTDVYLARSDNGGESFTNYKISETSFNPSESVFFGDYTNIDAYNGVIHPIWMRADGTLMSVWTALIYDRQLVTGVKENNKLPLGYKLYQNYPNPFNPSTIISYELPESGKIDLSVYNQLGEKVTTLSNGFKKKGYYEVSFNAENLSSGIYFYRLKSNKGILSGKMTLMK